MSLDILKENERNNLISKFKNEIKQKEDIISKLNEEGNNLAKEVLKLEKERKYLFNELNSTRDLESGVFSVKEKEYIKEIESHKNIITEIKSDIPTLHKKIDKYKDRIPNTIIFQERELRSWTNTLITFLDKNISIINFHRNYFFS